jgi:hypothetical protein
VNPAWRAKALLLSPTAEWARIEQESGEPMYLLSRYAALIALIPALCGFVGVCVIGAVVPGTGTVRAPIFDGVFGAIFGYVTTIGIVLLLGLFIAVLAPLFGGRRNFDSAFKLAFYSYTPVWLAGIFLLLPGLHFLVLTGFYGAYVVWVGLPRLMKLPEQKSPVYAALVIACACALTLIAALAQRAVFGQAGI